MRALLTECKGKQSSRSLRVQITAHWSGRKTRGHYTAASHLRQTVFPNLSDKPTEDGRLRRMFTVQDKIRDLLQHLNCTRDLTAVEDFSMFYLHHTGTMNGVLFLRATKVFFPIKLK